MSYPGVEPADVQEQTNPVGTQEPPAGEPMKFIEKSDPTGKFDKILEPQPEKPDATSELTEEQIQEAVQKMFKVTDAWLPKDKIKFKHEFPSGQTSLIQHLDTMDLIEHDLLEDLDFFTRRLFPKNIDPSGNPVEHVDKEETLLDSLRDPDKRKKFLDLTGKLLAVASVEPKVIHDGVVVKEVDGKKKTVFGYQLEPEEYLEAFGHPLKKLEGNESYSGPIDFTDRMSLFHELNRPLKTIEPFRYESATLLPDLAGVEGHGGEAE